MSDNFNQLERNYESSLEADYNAALAQGDKEQEELAELEIKVDHNLTIADKDTAILIWEAIEQREDLPQVMSMLRSYFLTSKQDIMSAVFDEAIKQVAQDKHNKGERA